MSAGFVVTTETYLIVLPIIFLAGLVDAIAGGGGLLSVPGYLASGMPPAFVLGTNKFSAAFGTAVSAARFAKNKIVDFPVALKTALVALGGSYLGAMAALHMDQSFLKYVLVVVIPLVTLVTLRKPHLGAENKKDTVSGWVKNFASPLIAGGLGFYDGFFGPGTGSFLVLFFAGVLRYDFATANGNTKIVNLATNISALLTFIHGGAILYEVGIPAALANICGNLVGSRLVIRRGSAFIRPVFLGVLAILFGKILFDLLPESLEHVLNTTSR